MTNEEVARQLSNNNYLTEDDKELCPSEDTKIRINSYWAALKMAKWKDEQYQEEKKELLSLVNLLHVDEHNQTIIEDLKAILK